MWPAPEQHKSTMVGEGPDLRAGDEMGGEGSGMGPWEQNMGSREFSWKSGHSHASLIGVALVLIS